MSVRDELERRLPEISGVARRPSRRGPGHTYFAGDREVARFHGDQRLDVRLTRVRIRRQVSDRGFDERVRTRGRFADWVAVRVAGLHDLPPALSFVEEAVRANLRLGDAAGASARDPSPSHGSWPPVRDYSAATETEWIAGNWNGTWFHDLPASGEANSWPVVVPT